MLNLNLMNLFRQHAKESVFIIFFSSMSKAIKRQISDKGTVLTAQSCLDAIRSRGLPILFNLSAHLALSRTLSDPIAIGLKRRHPRLEYKYLKNYLALNFSIKTRLTILTSHYKYLQQYVTQDFLDKIFDNRPALWQDLKEEHALAITLSFPRSFTHQNRPLDHEGDLSVVFEIDHIPIYKMCFTIVPGTAINLLREHVIYIGCIQGASGQFENIRQATKICHEVPPSTLLLYAIQAIARSLDIDAIVGVSTQYQLSNHYGFMFDYDEFWETLDGKKISDHAFFVPLPFSEKPLDLIKQKHRSRTLRKRKFRDDLAEQVQNNFQQNYLKQRSE